MLYRKLPTYRTDWCLGLNRCRYSTRPTTQRPMLQHAD